MGLQFKAYVQTRPKHKILVGGEKYACVEINYKDNDLDLDLYADGVRQASCFLNNDSEMLDTKELIKASVYFLKYLKPESCYLDFTDASNKDGNMLAYSGIFFNEKTWYEKHFQAELINVEDKNDYIKLKNNLKSKEFKSLINFTRLLKDSKVSQDKINILEELLNESETFYDFGQKIYKRYENRNDTYELLKSWLSPFFKKPLGGEFLLEKRWKISCEKVETKGFTIEKTEPFELKSIKKKPIQMGCGVKKLTERNKESLKNPNWIMWKDLNLREYLVEDQKYLKKLLKKFNQHPENKI